MIRILLVEDDKNQLKRIKEILEAKLPDYEIHAASSLNQAKDKIRELRAISLVITDYLLDEKTASINETGYELLKFCQDHLTNVPVIIFTAYGEDEEKEVRAALSFQKGAFDFMRKPLDFDELIERIKHALEVAEDLA